MKTIWIFLVASFLFSFISCENEITVPVISNIKISGHILPGYFITAISFDSKGTAWLGTFRQGLIRYDGSITVYNSSNSNLPDSLIMWDVAVDRNDNIWIGTSGLIKYDHNNFTIFNSSNSPLPEDVVWSIIADKNNILWLASCRFREGGLVRYDQNVSDSESAWTVYIPGSSSLPSNSVNDIAIGPGNHKWVTMSESLNNGSIVEIIDSNWKIFGSEEIGFKPYFLRNIAVSKKGDVYASLDYGLSSSYDINRPNIIMYTGQKWTVNNPVDEKGNSLGYVGPINVDNYGNLWALVENSNANIAIYNNNRWIYYKLNFPASASSKIEIDAHNKIWIGTGDGVYFVDTDKSTSH